VFLASVRELFQDAACDRRAVPGMIASLQSYGDDPSRFHPYLHSLVTDGLVSPEGSLIPIPCPDPVCLMQLNGPCEDYRIRGSRGLRLQAPSYLFASRRLFYVVYPGGNSQLLGVDNSVRPPSLDIDVDRLTALAKASTHVPIAKGMPTMLIYAVCVCEAGQIVAVQTSNDPSDEVPEIMTALGKAHVTSPGRRGDVPVPTALMVMIPIR